MRNFLTAMLGLAAATGAQAQTTEVRVHYAIPTIWAETQAALETAFEAQNPEIDIVIDGPAESYGEGVQRLLRESVAGNLPDVAFVGLNRWRILEARGLTQPLDPFMADMDADAAGYTQALLSLGQFAGTQHSLATSASTLVAYLNPDLVSQAGHDPNTCPQSFNDLVTLAADIDALGDNIDGIWIDRHDWRFQSLLGAHGGRPMNVDESDITFDSYAGIAAANLYQEFAETGGMPGYIDDQARQAYPAGNLGIMMDSSSLLTRFTQAAGDRFDVTVCPLPIAANPEDVYFPTGGSALVMLTDDPETQQAAWDYMRFVTGPDGARLVVENTGYAPTNARVLRDEAYLGDFYEDNPNALRAHEQVAAFAGPWYAYPGAEGVAVTDLISEALWDISGGETTPQERINQLAETVRTRLDMQ
ncbi:extracellular solute-binding protein [Rhodobacteraceae bacterium W635]|uniref:extracellular solute-binding protein n=1 Tax=Nioella halotolerans TaxID=2303578 RepID=UPI000E3C0176|nr:extracellular solute-binding protein [Rhodobacteraceae bacterium W635]